MSVHIVEPTHEVANPATLSTGPTRRFGRPSIVAGAVVAAVVVNLVIWAVGALAGGSFEFTDGGETMSAAPGGVVFLTAIPLGVGLAVAALVSRRWLGVIRPAQVVGSLLALATIGLTLSADFDGASTVALSLTHVTLVPVLVVALELVRRPVDGQS